MFTHRLNLIFMDHKTYMETKYIMIDSKYYQNNIFHDKLMNSMVTMVQVFHGQDHSRNSVQGLILRYSFTSQLAAEMSYPTPFLEITKQEEVTDYSISWTQSHNTFLHFQVNNYCFKEGDPFLWQRRKAWWYQW